LARGPIVDATALTEDPWTGNPYPIPDLSPLPNPNPSLTLTLLLSWTEVRWVVDGFNLNRKNNFRPGWGKSNPNPNR